MQRVLEPVLRLVDLLGPLGLFLGTEDPALVVLGFDHEDAERGDDDVVDLGGALAVGPWQIDVSEGTIELRIELLETDAAYHDLAQPTLENGTGQDFQEEPQNEQRGEPWPKGNQGSKHVPVRLPSRRLTGNDEWRF